MTFKEDFREGVREGYYKSKTLTVSQKVTVLCMAFTLLCIALIVYLAL